MKNILGAFVLATAFSVAGSMSAEPAQAKPFLSQASNAKASDKPQMADRAVTDISARRYYRRYGYGYRPRYYRSYGYARPYRPYGYYGGGYYRRPGIYLGF